MSSYKGWLQEVVLGILAMLSLVVFIKYYGIAFPAASIDFKLSKDDVIKKARNLLKE